MYLLPLLPDRATRHLLMLTCHQNRSSSLVEHFKSISPQSTRTTSERPCHNIPKRRRGDHEDIQRSVSVLVRLIQFGTGSVWLSDVYLKSLFPGEWLLHNLTKFRSGIILISRRPHFRFVTMPLSDLEASQLKLLTSVR